MSAPAAPIFDPADFRIGPGIVHVCAGGETPFLYRHDEALRRLFEEERDPIAVIKWKEVLDFLEEATDRCEDVANVLEGVVVKHG